MPSMACSCFATTWNCNRSDYTHVTRGMLKPRSGVSPGLGKPETRQAWLQYPYAEDGLDLWNWYMSYFGKSGCRACTGRVRARMGIKQKDW